MDGFEILKKLGDGAYSIVYKVRRKQDNKIYALKKVKLQNLSDKEKENALNEVRILASVKSPFVISYKEAFIEDSDSSLCLIMEYADNGDLYQTITKFKKMGCLLEEVDVWRIFIQMVLGLKSLHDKKILHRDLKSANIFLTSEGNAKIGDLNVSKVAKKGLGYTQTGTPYYASPEVWKDNPYDSKSDIWSLGCVTYEMVTLHPPFRAQDMEGLYKKVIKGVYPRVSDNYSNDLSELIKMLLKVNAGERPSCNQILKHPIVKKRLEYFQAQNGIENFEEGIDESELLKTIRIPKNILFLTDRLPGANYEPNGKNKKEMNNSKKNTFPNNNLPDIKKKIIDGIENNKKNEEGEKKNDNHSLEKDKKKNISLEKDKNNNNNTNNNSNIINNNKNERSSSKKDKENNNNNNKINNSNINVNKSSNLKIIKSDSKSKLNNSSNIINNNSQIHNNSSSVEEKKINLNINERSNSKNNISRSPNNNYDKEKNVNMYILGLEKDRVISQRRYQQQKRIKQQKYIEGLGLSELYKIYAPSLEINNYGHKNNIINNKRSYDYSYHKNKKPIYNYNYNYNYNTNNSNEYLPKVIPNRRLNPIKNNIKYY